MKLKYLVAAMGLVASIGAQAAIGGPKGTAADPSAAPELFAVVYDENSSFTIDLGVTFSSFLASGGTTSTTWATLTSSDSLWNSFITTADTSNLRYAVIGSGASTTAGAPYPILTTVQAGDESTTTSYTTKQVITAGIQVQAYVNEVNKTGTHKTVANGESVNTSDTSAYFDYYTTSTFNDVLFNNTNAVNSKSEFTLVYSSAGPFGDPLSEKVQAGTVLLSGSGTNYSLTYTANVAAVPEPTGYALALAGFGAFGLLARRRRSN